jgi:hypothetical protein
MHGAGAPLTGSDLPGEPGAMSRPHNRKQQKKLQKAKNKRADARRKRDARALRHTPEALLARAMTAPFGPCWISAALDGEQEDDGPALISVVITRRVGVLLLPCLVLVDRTCLGVKNTFTTTPLSELEMERMRRDLAGSGDPLRETDLLTAQSVIYHAIDYAKSLGFAPHRDFVPELIGERPSALLDTPLARPERPLYVSGPADNVQQILARLDAAVGPGNYDFIDAFESDDEMLDWDGVDDEGDEDILDEEDNDVFHEGSSEVLTVEGHEVGGTAPPVAQGAARRGLR